MNRIFVTADTHFNHEMLLKFRTQFRDIEEMNSQIVQRINKFVKKDDSLIILGDVCMKNKSDFIENILPQINGDVHIIRGNHDSKSLSSIKNIIIEHEGKDIEMVHRPIDATFCAKIVLHGHIHKTGDRTMPYIGKQINDHIFLQEDRVVFFNVNLEFHKFRPLLLEEILGEIKSSELI